jgi:hypothetical protein
MDALIRQLVRDRAGHRCEYCLLRQADLPLIPFHIEHVIPCQHGGADDISNLALACHRCNLNKGPNLASLDPATGAIVPLFHPRLQRWEDHFEWRGVLIVGTTPVGRITVRILAMNEDLRVQLRHSRLSQGPTL